MEMINEPSHQKFEYPSEESEAKGETRYKTTSFRLLYRYRENVIRKGIRKHASITLLSRNTWRGEVSDHIANLTTYVKRVKEKVKQVQNHQQKIIVPILNKRGGKGFH
jgi:undecaprenyl pyrophosphate synthase